MKISRAVNKGGRMRILRVGDKVRVITDSSIFTKKGEIDIIQEAEYNPNGERMDYVLFRNGAWFHNEDLEFISEDKGETLIKLCREEGIL